MEGTHEDYGMAEETAQYYRNQGYSASVVSESDGSYSVVIQDDKGNIYYA